FPFAALVTVLGLRTLHRAGAVAAALLLVAQIASVVQVARLHVAPDTGEQAASWIAEHLDRRSARIAISPTTELPLFRTSAALGSDTIAPKSTFAPWIEYQRTLAPATLDTGGFTITDLPLRLEQQRRALVADPRAFLDTLGADYLVLEVFDESERPVFA